MSEHMDQETGELRPNGIAARASSFAASAKVQIERDRSGYGATGLHFAVWQAVQTMPIWITTDKSGAHKIKYATLKAILEVVRPALTTHGVRIRQGADRSWGADEGGGVKGRLVPVYTDLVHVPTGEFERTQIEIPVSRLDAQSMGSAITYGRRYTLLAALGLATDEADDDGRGAMPNDITARVQESDELSALKAEVSKVKEATKLAELGRDEKFKKRANQLSSEEATLLRTHYQDHGRKLVGDPE